MPDTRVGPRLIVVQPKLECRGCVHLVSEYYCIEDGNSVDSGYDYSCEAKGGRSVDSQSKTPEWCPHMPVSSAPKPAGVPVAELQDMLKRGREFNETHHGDDFDWEWHLEQLINAAAAERKGE